jgi:hypothetical protein
MKIKSENVISENTKLSKTFLKPGMTIILLAKFADIKKIRGSLLK